MTDPRPNLEKIKTLLDAQAGILPTHLLVGADAAEKLDLPGPGYYRRTESGYERVADDLLDARVAEGVGGEGD